MSLLATRNQPGTSRSFPQDREQLVFCHLPSMGKPPVHDQSQVALGEDQLSSCSTARPFRIYSRNKGRRCGRWCCCDSVSNCSLVGVSGAQVCCGRCQVPLGGKPQILTAVLTASNRRRGKPLLINKEEGRLAGVLKGKVCYVSMAEVTCFLCLK